MKAYVINLSMLPEDVSVDFNKLSDDEFKDMSIKYGEVYSLRGFENAYNHDEFLSQSDSYIRFID